MWGLLAILGLYIGANIYIALRLWQMVAMQPLWLRIALVSLLVIVALALFISFALRDTSIPSVISGWLFNIGSIWLVFALYMSLALIVTDIAKLLIPQLHNGTLYALIGVTLLLIYGNINYRHPRIEHISIETDKLLDEHSYRMAVVSDIHLGYGTNRERLSRYVDVINSQQPDVVVIVGDLIDNSILPVVQEDMCREFEHVTARDGIYMVAGNHEYISDIEACNRYLQNSPVRLVRDSVVRLSSGIQLLCRDDRSNRQRATIEELLQQSNSDYPTVVLDHQPYDIATSDRCGVDIHLSGHTHRGQIWPLSWMVDAMYDQSYGYRKWEQCHAIVSSGLSLWGPPFRIGTQSELWVIDIQTER